MRNHLFVKFVGTLLGSVFFLQACVSLPEIGEREPSYALAEPEVTPVGEVLRAAAKAHPGKTGAILLDDAQAALLARNAMAGLATQTIDAQYYIWSADRTGRLLLQRLIEAAERGVRVRLLVDDHTVESKDKTLAVINAHPNIELRIFNPFPHRGMKALGWVTNFSQVTHRMHNKLFIADNALGIVGGRNIGDTYFGLSKKYNVRDLDVLLAGDAVGKISDSFDVFWNSPWAYPMEVLYPHVVTAEALEQSMATLAMQVEEDKATLPYEVDYIIEDMYKRLETLPGKLIWAEAEVLYDLPEKVETKHSEVSARASELLNVMQEELVAEVAYFIPGSEGVENLADMVDRGVRVQILTNSLAANNVLPAYAGYATYRRRLIEAGVDLREYRPDAKDREDWPEEVQDAPTTLHTKTYVIDKRYVFIGSVNADPRSKWLNTEIGVVLDSEELAQKVLTLFTEGASGPYSYELHMEPSSKNLSWYEGTELDRVIHNVDPESTLWQRNKARLLRILPIESQL